MNAILVSSTKRGIYKFPHIGEDLSYLYIPLTKEEAEALGSVDLFLNPCLRITIRKGE